MLSPKVKINWEGRWPGFPAFPFVMVAYLLLCGKINYALLLNCNEVDRKVLSGIFMLQTSAS